MGSLVRRAGGIALGALTCNGTMRRGISGLTQATRSPWGRSGAPVLGALRQALAWLPPPTEDTECAESGEDERTGIEIDRHVTYSAEAVLLVSSRLSFSLLTLYPLRTLW